MRTRTPAVLAVLALLAGLVTTVATIQAADHLEAPLVQADGRTDINDLYVFQSPEDSGSTVLIMTVNPAAGALSPTTFDPDAAYTFNIDQDLGDPDDATVDATISVDFGPPDASGTQSVTITGAVSGSGTTGSSFTLDGGGQATADVFDDPFFFDLAAFNGTVKGIGEAALCEVEGDTTGVDFLAGFNVSAIVLEVPSSAITDASSSIGVWAETSDGTIIDTVGRPAIATALVPDGAEDVYNMADRDADDAAFGGIVTDVLMTLSGLDGTGYSMAEASALADAFLPDILTVDTASPDGYGGPTTVLNGRQLTDDVIDISFTVVTGDASAVGGADVGAVLTTDCVDANDKKFLLTFPYLAAPHGAGAPAPVTTYALVLENLTSGQPISPPVAVTHNSGLPTAITVAELGGTASAEINAIARGGDPMPLVDMLETRRDLAPAIVTDVVNLGRPLPPRGVRTMGFADKAIYTIDARPGDVLSVFGMLICTNDGLAGLDRVALPITRTTYMISAYDAGSEENTELSEHLVDPCSGLGPVGLPGDPDGNLDAGVGIATDPAGVISVHPGIDGTVGDLTSAHAWTDPVASLTVVPLVDAFSDDNASGFEANIDLLFAAEITRGTSATTFSPNDFVTRGQMAAFINRALMLPAAADGPFTDIAGTGFEADINALFAAGITTGTSATTFSPNDFVTRGQVAAFITRALGPR